MYIYFFHILEKMSPEMAISIFVTLSFFVLVRKMAYIRVSQIDWISLGKYLWNTNLKFI